MNLADNDDPILSPWQPTDDDIRKRPLNTYMKRRCDREAEAGNYSNTTGSWFSTLSRQNLCPTALLLHYIHMYNVHTFSLNI